MFKLGSLQDPSKAELKAEAHFNIEKKDWKDFERSLRTKTFQNVILKHPDADSKLKRYVKNFGAYLRAKDVVARVPSRSKPSAAYKIKRLESGRLACGCKDWQYVHSVKGTDCDHIKASKALKSKAASAALNVALGATLARHMNKNKTEAKRGRIVKNNVMRLRLGQPLQEIG